jgi:type IV secretion system protein VirB8
MKANKKTGLTREAIKEFNESRKGLEVDLMDEVLKSRRTAWMVATGSAVVTVFALSLVGYVVHKYSQPIRTSANAQRGHSRSTAGQADPRPDLLW